MGLRNRKKAQREQRIMQAGRELFIKKGFGDTTMEEIAEHADVGVGTLYNYFKNKNALLVAIFDEVHLEAVEKIEAVVKDPPADPVEGVLAVLMMYDTWYGFGKPLLRELFAVIFQQMGGMGSEFMQMDLEVMGQLGVLLNEYQRRGVLAADLNVQEAVMLIYGCFFTQITMFVAMDGMTMDMLQIMSRRQFELMFRGLLPRESQ